MRNNKRIFYKNNQNLFVHCALIWNEATIHLNNLNLGLVEKLSSHLFKNIKIEQ